MPAGPVTCAASPASQTRPRRGPGEPPFEATSIDQPISMALFSNQGARSGISARVAASSRCGKKRSPSIVATGS